MRNYVIVAPYGNKELDEACENTNNYPVVYLRSDIARQSFEKKKGIEFTLLFCEKMDYEGMPEAHYCQDVVEKAFDVLAQRHERSKHIIVVLPTELVDFFLKELALMRKESHGDTLIPPFTTLIEKFDISYTFMPECVFSVQWIKGSGGYVANLDTYYVDDPKREPTYSSMSIEEKAAIESMYTVLLSGDQSNLNTLELSQLEKLEKRSLQDERYDIAANIRDIRRNKAS